MPVKGERRLGGEGGRGRPFAGPDHLWGPPPACVPTTFREEEEESRAPIEFIPEVLTITPRTERTIISIGKHNTSIFLLLKYQ